MQRQVSGVLHGQGLDGLESDDCRLWQAGEPPELHVSIPGTRVPVVVTVSEDLYVWHRCGGEMACPVSLFHRALELVIYTVNVS
ncbi:hypothetical protein [Nocardiopsis algeriensis]|uniref:Uncharacterized protein n=1 Tax=Nocardiopsis algeriensis TaxID=1478215 RepID=A0A841IPW5_9ACTN|nr:hypothetical protein [Nocardiopsis algeriensis]MBB6118371.1 hypothetical protein [Nocardiopsis algeriensis]